MQSITNNMKLMNTYTMIMTYKNIFLQALLQSELDKVSQRNDDLRKQIVTSPDKLRAVRSCLC